jgi:putative membrane protein
MIVARSANLPQMLRYIGRPLAVLFVVDVLIVVAYVFAGCKWLAVEDIPLSIFGGVIGVIVGFRNSSAYARWWEARTVWGSIVNNSRSLGRQVLSMIIPPGDDPHAADEVAAMQRQLLFHQIAWVHALRQQLRGLPVMPEVAGLLEPEATAAVTKQANIALAIQQRMANALTACRQRGWLDDRSWQSLDRSLSSLTDAQGAAERIKNTPLPRQYDVSIRCFTDLFCLLLPLGMVSSLGLLTPIGSTCVGLIFLVLEQIGRDLENPFDNTPHDIALSAMCRNIEINLKQMLGEVALPEPLTPVDGVLW